MPGGKYGMAEVMLLAADDSWLWPAVGLAAVPVLILLNAFFVAAEFALVSIRRTKVEELVNRKIKGAAALDEATKSLDRSIATTQLGITLASIALGWVGEPAIADTIQPFFDWLPGVWSGVTTHSVAAAFALLIVTFMHVVFGEFVPKSMAIQSTDRLSLWLAPPLLVMRKLSRPLIWIMRGTGNAALRLMGFRPAQPSESVHSVEELQLLIEDTEEAGILDEEQADIVQNVFMLSDKTVRDCMVPRDKMACLDISMSSDQIMAAVREGAHTRMPVLDKATGKVVGIVNTKDLFYLFSLAGVVLLDDALYPATYLEPDETVANALKLFKKSHKPMALVRDADENILGLLTLEDILEEIVGDIEDEHDIPVRRLRIRTGRKTGLFDLRKLREAEAKTNVKRG
jgi:CBS domain containing-hemolysin-like protein